MFRYLGYGLLLVALVSTILFFTVAPGYTTKVTALMSGLVGVGTLVFRRVFSMSEA